MIEQEMRKKISLECLNYKTNFQGIDFLMKMENDWHIAQKEDNYNFESCPNNFNCLENFVGLCEKEDADNDSKNYQEKVEQCQNCWKKALRGE